MKAYCGNCVSAFNTNGDCIIPDLPWGDVSALAVALENAEPITAAEFRLACIVPEDYDLTRPDLEFLRTPDGVLVVYDDSTDIHHFWL